jgi:hypothetical protein
MEFWETQVLARVLEQTLKIEVDPLLREIWQHGENHRGHSRDQFLRPFPRSAVPHRVRFDANVEVVKRSHAAARLQGDSNVDLRARTSKRQSAEDGRPPSISLKAM